MTKTNIFFASLFAISSTAYADGFRSEISIEAASAEIEVANLLSGSNSVLEANEMTSSFGLSIYFSEVDSGEKPHQEAVFSSRASGINLSASYAEVEDDASGEMAYDNFNSISGRFVIADSWTLELEGSSNSRESYSLGKYLTDEMEVFFNYTKADDSTYFYESAVSQFLGLNIYRESYGLGVEALRPLGDAFLSYEVQVDAINTSAGDGFGVALSSDYYFNTQFGLGAYVEYDEFETGDIDTFDIRSGVRASYFFTDSLSLAADIGYQEYEIEDIVSYELLSAGVKLSARF